MNYNKVILVGRLVREPENIVLSSGSQVSNLVVAYNRNYRLQDGSWKEESHFFEVKVFGKLAERVIPQLSKGDLVLIEGRLHQDKWLDKQTGEPRSKIRIVALDIKPLSRGRGAISAESEAYEQPDIVEPSPSAKEEASPPKGEGETFDELEELLFGEEEKPEKGKGEGKKEDIDDFDILL